MFKDYPFYPIIGPLLLLALGVVMYKVEGRTNIILIIFALYGIFVAVSLIYKYRQVLLSTIKSIIITVFGSIVIGYLFFKLAFYLIDVV